jgi:hypothetical protein
VAGLAAPADRVRDFVGVEDVRAQGANAAATSDLPLPMPPVRPMRYERTRGLVTNTSP